MRRIAFITESSTRQIEPMPANEFYQSPKSQWVNKIIEYMVIREFPTEDIYFLSFQQQKVIPFTSIVQPYPKSENKPTVSSIKGFLSEVYQFILQKEPEFVEFHTAKQIIAPLLKSLSADSIPFRVFAEGAALGQKGKVYEELITELQNKRRLKEIQREKWSLITDIEYLTPHEAEKLLEQIRSKEKIYGIEENVQELQFALKKYRESYRAAAKAKEVAEILLQKADDDLISFIKSISSPASLFKDLPRFEEIKSKYGKEIAKYTRYLIKQEYERKAESKIQDSLLRLQITLLK